MAQASNFSALHIDKIGSFHNNNFKSIVKKEEDIIDLGEIGV